MRSLLATVLLVPTLLSGCSGGADRDAGAGDPQGALGGPSAPSGEARATQEPRARLEGAALRARLQQLLDERARAVLAGDEAAFAAQLGGGPAWRERQRAWFRSVSRLPWSTLGWTVQDSDWSVAVADRPGAQVVVPRLTQTSQLRDFDAVPVQRTVGLVVVVRGDRLRIVDDRDAAGDRLFEGAPAPWDLVPVEVRRRGGVLGVFDSSTVASAPEVMGVLQRGVAQVDDALPFDWSGRVVVYVMGDRDVLDTFTDVPGGSVDLLGALTFPTYAGAGVTPVASTRMLLLAPSVAAGQPFLGRIVRHELSHVAIGPRDDAAPTWFSEGLAEYLGARDVPVSQRRIPTEAVRRATAPVAGLPASRDFNGPDQDWHYALSWMAVDALAASEGEDVLWRLLDAFGGRPAGTARDDDRIDARGARVLRRVTGTDEAGLARAAARRITDLYG